jgi:hypothetical protein
MKGRTKMDCTKCAYPKNDCNGPVCMCELNLIPDPTDFEQPAMKKKYGFYTKGTYPLCGVINPNSNCMLGMLKTQFQTDGQ